jgi:tetratricopeptide (TPR) repeat protein
MNLCKTLGWAGKRDEAYRAGMQATKLAPDIAAVHYEAGLAAQLYNRTNEAITQYTRALELNPELADAHCNLGGLLEERGQLSEAIAHYRLAVEHDQPNTVERDRRNLASALEKLRGLAVPGASQMTK